MEENGFIWPFKDSPQLKNINKSMASYTEWTETQTNELLYKLGCRIMERLSHWPKTTLVLSRDTGLVLLYPDPTFLIALQGTQVLFAKSRPTLCDPRDV